MENIWEVFACYTTLSGKDIFPSTIPNVSSRSLDFILSIPISLYTIRLRNSILKGYLDLSIVLGNKIGPSFPHAPSIIVPFLSYSPVSSGRDPYII
jgi:hypothetical protein